MAYASAAANVLNAATKAQPAAWVSLCSQTAPIVSSAVFMAPIPTIAKVRSSKSTGSLPLLPYSSMVVNAFLWMTYGILNKDSKIWSPNAFGLFMGLNYCLQFSKNVPKNASNLPGTMSQHFRFGSMMILFTMLVATMLDRGTASFLIGKLGVVVCVILFASPLSTLKKVLATKSAKSIPLPFTLACMLNCFLWSVAGLFDMKDFNIYFPNILGLLATLAQFGLKLIYGNGDPSISTLDQKLPL